MAPTIPDGFALIAGRGRDNARAALAAADAAGLPANVVRATTGGYLVPEKVLDFYESPSDAAAASAESSDETEGTDDGASTETGSAETETAATGTTEADGDAGTEGGTENDGADGAGETEGDQSTEKTVEQPPKSGAGSGEDAWVAWATEAHGYNPDEGLSRNEIIAKFAS